MADKEISVGDHSLNDAIYLEYYIWGDSAVKQLIVDRNNFRFDHDPLILKRLQIKNGYGVILNEVERVTYTEEIVINNTQFVPITIRALNIFQISQQDQEKATLFKMFKENNPAFYVIYDILFIDKLLDIPKVTRSVDNVSIKNNYISVGWTWFL